MSIEENKENIRRQIEECWNKGDFSSVPELVSPDFIYILPRKTYTVRMDSKTG